MSIIDDLTRAGFARQPLAVTDRRRGEPIALNVTRETCYPECA
jgi:hypothetical protein